MTYFERTATFPDFLNDEFRFNYNANTGGGQAFLAGQYRTPEGDFRPLVGLDGQSGVFEFLFRSNGHEERIPIGDQLRYEIRPRSQGHTSMKLAVEGRPSPSRLIATFFMLPPTCGVNNPSNPEFSPLAGNNYWLQSMLLEARPDDDDLAITHLVSSQFVFAGRGASRNGDAAPVYFRFRPDDRIRDVLSICEAAFLPQPIQERLEHFANIYSGGALFSYEESRDVIESLMRRVAREYPDRYSGVDDPLPLLASLWPSESTRRMTFNTGLDVTYERNVITFGAPGTGKSYRLNEWKDELLSLKGGDYERVTFHSEYSYTQFIGTYKPVPAEDSVGNETVTYKFVPGPFLRVLADALSDAQDSEARPYILLIEELNRAPAASVFGEAFQLLDRDHTNKSRYPIHPSEDVQTFLAEELGGVPSDYRELRIPDNMFIWASMNSADQGVFPLDTAFKRRWNFKYLGINEKEQSLLGKKVALGPGPTDGVVTWNSLRRAINDLLAELGINEDKQLGPFFLDQEIVVPDQGDTIDRVPFIEQFREKVLMYLFEDAARQYRATVFEGCETNVNRYSDICSEFDRLGLALFNEQIINQVTRDTLTHD